MDSFSLLADRVYLSPLILQVINLKMVGVK